MPAAAKGSLAEALVEFQRDLPTVTKDKTAKVKTKTGADYSYTYADLKAVTDAALPRLVQLGLSFTCQPRRCADGAFELVGVLRHVSGESDEGALPLHGRDPQEIGSSLTYGRRYLLGCMTGIVTEDDDDGAAAIGSGRTRRQDPPPTPEQVLGKARAGAWSVFKRTAQDPTPQAFQDAYEQWCGEPFVDAQADNFDQFARHLGGAEKQ